MSVVQRKQAFIDYLDGASNREIAEKYNVPISTVKWWVSDNFKKRIKEEGLKDPRAKPPKPKPRPGAPKGNKNAKGHGAPLRNQNATKHGLFAKYLPEETLALVEDVSDASPLDILWLNIKLKFAAIVRMQKIMHVASAADDLKYVSTSSEASNDPAGGMRRRVIKREEVITALEREEKYIYAQSRAMDTLARMIRQYEELVNNTLATEEQKARIAKIRMEVDYLKLQTATHEEEKDGISPYVDALRGEVAAVWKDEDVDGGD